jgi:hypothetical protein
VRPRPRGASVSTTSRIQTLHIPLAYIDPGSGSLIVQAVIAGAVAAPIVLRNQLRRAGSAIRRAIGGNRAERSKE